MEDTEEAINTIKAIMAEHSINYAFAIIDEDGDLRYDYSNWRVGRMLFSDSLADMDTEVGIGGFDWDDIEEDEEDE
ncbi:MAG: hypothetical protein IZT59_05000 [Verrucomicrobia bacterium]|nr:hypothetical protein [Verrucomicrobiota bacterium]